MPRRVSHQEKTLPAPDLGELTQTRPNSSGSHQMPPAVESLLLWPRGEVTLQQGEGWQRPGVWEMDLQRILKA